MEPALQIVKYVPGQPIDTNKILVVAGLTSPEEWLPIESAYAEIRTVGPHAPFRNVDQLTIFPPQMVHRGILYMLVDSIHRGYPHPDRRKPTSVLVYKNLAYPEIHIYRVWPSKWRRG